MLIKHNRQATRRERENADFRGVVFFIFLLMIGHFDCNRMEAGQRLPSFLTLFFCNVSVPEQKKAKASRVIRIDVLRVLGFSWPPPEVKIKCLRSRDQTRKSQRKPSSVSG